MAATAESAPHPLHQQPDRQPHRPEHPTEHDGGEEITDKRGVRSGIDDIFDHIHPNDGTFDSCPHFRQGDGPVGREIDLEPSCKFD